jgi:type III secretory pathway component EscS
MSRIAEKIVRSFGCVVLTAIGLGLVAALVGVLVALIGAYVAS